MDQPSLISFCEELLKLKEKLKCPICYDIIQDTAELVCGHRLCVQCHSQHKVNSKNQQHKCPICKTVISRRFVIYKDEFSDKLGSFVSTVCNKIEEKKGYRIEEIIHHSQKLEAKEGNVKSSKIEKTVVSKPTLKEDSFDKKMKTPKEENIVCGRSRSNTRKDTKLIIMISAKENVKNEKISDPCSSKDSDLNKVIKFEKEENKFKSKTNKYKMSHQQMCADKFKPTDHDSFTSKEDAFDKLMKTSNEFFVNKKGSTKKYTRKKTDQAESVDYKILEFEDSFKKHAVLQWLSDNKNKFNRMTQTQNVIQEEHLKNKATIDHISVSQINKTKTLYCRPKKNRPRSLDLEIKPKKDKTRRSDGSILGVENYAIEDINTEDFINKAEENVLMKMIENRCLDKMENKVQNNADNARQDNQITQTSTSGWQRIQNITKTLRKKEKIPKKLNITLQQSQASGKKGTGQLIVQLKNEDLKETANQNQTDNKVQVDLKNHNVREHSQPKVTRLYDLKEFEHYVEENIKEIPEGSSQSYSNKENDENAINVIPPKVVILENILVKHGEDVDLYGVPTQKLIHSNQSFEKNEDFVAANEDNRSEQRLENHSICKTSDFGESFHDLQDFSEVMIKLQENLQRYSENLDQNKHSTKRHIGSIQKLLNKLNDLHNSQNNVPIKIDQGDQTENIMTDCQMQTESVNQDTSGVICEKCKNTETTNPKDCSTSIQRPELSRLGGNSGKSESPKVLQNDDFAGTLDLLNFETQEVVKQYAQKIIKENSLMENKQLSEQEKNTPTSLICTNDNKENNAGNHPKEVILSDEANAPVYTLENNVENASKFGDKRTLSDSETSDVMPVPKRRRGGFIRDDLSIEFGSSEKLRSQNKNYFATGLSLESDEENNEEYLNKILKKYENGGNCSTSSPSRSKDNMDIEPEDNFDNIVAAVNKNIERLSKQNESVKSSYKTASQSSRNSANDDNIFLNTHDTSKVDIKKKSKEHFESSDVIAETESLEPLPKKARMNKFNEGFQDELSLNTDEQAGIKRASLIKATYCHELEDSLDADFGNIEMEEKNDNKSNEEDLFSEDDDIVETTPQKQSSFVEKRSQTNVVTNLSSRFPALDEVDREIIENFEFNFGPLSPPPGFEDNNDDIAPNDSSLDPKLDTVIYRESSVNATRTSTTEEVPQAQENSPDELSQGKSINSLVLPSTLDAFTPLNVRVRKLSHSTPITQKSFQAETLGLSPIVQESSLFRKAYTSSTVKPSSSQETPRKHSILTDDPKQKSILNYVKPSQGTASNNRKQKPCIACTRLSKDQMQNVSLLTNKKLATYSSKFNDTVTHMVVTVDKNKRIKDYTMKFVSAVASGIWIVGFEWIQECLNTNSIVSEEPYEALDDSGNSGPKTARLTKLENPLFKDYKFFCVNPLYSATAEDVEDVITWLGGVTVQNLDDLKDKGGKICLIITEGRSTQDFEVYGKWLEKYKIATVDVEWLSRSVGRYKIVSIRPYIWCSDDMLDDIGYPSHLTEVSSPSFEQF